MIIDSFGEEETMNIGKMLGGKAKKGDVFCLVGEISAGKTHLTKGFAKGLLIQDDIISPTFTIVNSYESGKIPFHHFDVYRIENIEELENIGFYDYIDSDDNICLIEWAEMIESAIPNNAIWIKIGKDLTKGENYRFIEIEE